MSAKSTHNTEPPKKFSVRLRGKIGAGLLRGLGQLPLLVNRRLGGGIGNLVWLFQGKTVQTCIHNIEKCLPYLPETERRAMAKTSIKETVRTALETATIWRKPYADLSQFVLQLENLDLLNQKMDKGKGVLMLVPHLGNWEILGDFLAQHYRVCYMFQPTGLHEIDDLMRAGRSKSHQLLAPTDRKGVSMVLQHLKAGHLAAILPDQVPDKNGGQIVPFFKQPAWTMTLVHKLVKRTGCEVILAFAKRVPNGFDIIFREPVAELGDDNQTTSLLAMNRSVEQLVAIAPEQYQWEYKRFKGIKNNT